MKKKTMRAVVVKPFKKAEIVEIGSELSDLQKLVGGWIEVVYPFDDLVGIVCNEEGKLNGLLPNRPLFDGDGNLYDILVGTFAVVGLSEDNFDSLNEETAIKYADLFNSIMLI